MNNYVKSKERETRKMTELKFADVILRQRKMRNMTQEELATALGVSAQAVSNWERGGYPDITMLPAIANYFEMTIDALLGNDEVAQKEDIAAFFRKVREELPNEDMDSRIRLGKEYTLKYPKNYAIAHEMCWIIYRSNSDVRREHMDLLRSLCNKIISECTTQTYREGAVEIMCTLGDDDDWEKWSQMCAEDYGAYRGEVLEKRLLEQKKYDECILRKGANKLELFCHLLTANCGNWSDPEKELAWIEYRINLMRSFGEGGGIPAAWQGYYAVMLTYAADKYFCLGMNEKGYEHLEDAYRNFVEWSSIPEGTALDVGQDWMFHGVKALKNEWSYLLATGEETYSNYMHIFTDRRDFLEHVMKMPQKWHGFDRVKSDERYYEILKQAELLSATQN